MEIEPMEDGGHLVTHHYKEEMRKSGSAHAGIAMHMPEPERHAFGKDEGHKMMAHVAEHLAIPEPDGERQREEEIESDDHENAE
jgi:hypothetical protein